MPTLEQIWKTPIIPAPAANLKADPSKKNWTALSYLFYTYASLQDARVEIAGLAAAVKALAESKGADPAAIAELVDRAVRDRLDRIELTVTDAPAS